jgi:hypothetical protein
MKPLLVIFNPRSIPEFYTAIEKINGISKLWIKYFPQDEAYKKAREFFLQSDYTHFMILPDDLIVTQKDVDAIVNYDESYDSISGWCNNNGRDETNIDTNISAFLPPDPPRTATYEGYRWYKIAQIESLLSKVKDSDSDAIIPVLHQGFALSRLSRRLIEQVPFRTDAGCCVDSCLSLDLMNFRDMFTQYVDIRIRMKHLKIPRSELLVGKEKAKMLLENWLPSERC